MEKENISNRIINPWSFNSLDEFTDYALKRVYEYYRKQSLICKCGKAIIFSKSHQHCQDIESTIDV